jgi:hypothetical protein
MTSSDSSESFAPWLRSWRQGRISTNEALSRFDHLAAIDPAELIGRWRGSGLHTGHPLDGLLERFGWYGKEFQSPEAVCPLLFKDAKGSIYSADPARLPLNLVLRMPALARSRLAPGLFSAFRLLLRTRSPTARLREITYRRVASAAIIYDRIPVIDYLRRIDERHVLGLMDLRSMPLPLLFLLSRDRD